MAIDELFVGGRYGRHLHLKWNPKMISWRNFFLVLNQVVHFYNTRDTNPEFWYPGSGGSGTPVGNPDYALQPNHVPGARLPGSMTDRL